MRAMHPRLALTFTGWLAYWLLWLLLVLPAIACVAVLRLLWALPWPAKLLILLLLAFWALGQAL